MDTELDPSDILESVESTLIPQNNPPSVWPRQAELSQKKKWNLWTPVLTEYYGLVDNPKKLPTILQPLLSKERAFTFGNRPPFYFNFPIHVPDEFGVHRRLYLNLCQQNFIVGAFGATLVGIATRHFAVSPTRIHSLLAQRLLLGKPLQALTKMLLTASVMTTSIGLKLAVRVTTGGVIYDLLKRSRDESKTQHSADDHWINAGMAGGICGLLFGIRAGLPHAWLAAGLCSAGAVMSEFIPPQELTMTNWFGGRR